MNPQIIWYKRDLRILDHASLFHAAKQGHVIPLYIVEPFLFERDYLTKRHLHFIYESLLDLKASLRSIGLDLYLYIGDALSCFELLKDKLHTFDIHAHMEHGTTLTYERDMRIHAWCEKHALTFHEYPNFGVKRAKDFKYRLRDFHGWVSEGVYPVPKDATLYQLDEFGIQDVKDILNVKAKGHPITWLKGGEKEAIQHAKKFFTQRFKTYQVYINKPAKSSSSSSLLSPYLAFGNLSIRMLHIATRKHLKDTTQPFHLNQLKAFEKRLYWHCHFVQRVERHPELDDIPWDKSLEGLRHEDQEILKAFQEGKTGFPFVDANIIALHKRGWINFKQRAMLASFASNVLMLDWRLVGKVLAELFIDYEPGIHWSQIQMQAGLNPFRHVPMYDISKQCMMHDEEGIFIKTMIPSLNHLEMPLICTPWLLDDNPYMKPIIDLKTQFETSKKILYTNKKQKQHAKTLLD